MRMQDSNSSKVADNSKDNSSSSNRIIHSNSLNQQCMMESTVQREILSLPRQRVGIFLMTMRTVITSAITTRIVPSKK